MPRRNGLQCNFIWDNPMNFDLRIYTLRTGMLTAWLKMSFSPL